MVEDVAAIRLLRSVPALRGVHHAARIDAVELAPVEDGHAVAEDEIGVAFDITVGEVLTRRHAGAVITVAVAAGGEQRVLGAGDAQVAEDGAVASHVQSYGLALARAGVVDD